MNGNHDRGTNGRTPHPTLGDPTPRQTTRDGLSCRGCLVGEECLLVDGLVVTVLDVIERYHGTETNATGLGILIRSELAEWHDCAQGREHLDDLLDGAAADGTTADGLRLLLRRNLRVLHGA